MKEYFVTTDKNKKIGYVKKISNKLIITFFFLLTCTVLVNSVAYINYKNVIKDKKEGIERIGNYIQKLENKIVILTDFTLGVNNNLVKLKQETDLINYIPSELMSSVVEIVANKRYGSGAVIHSEYGESFILTAAHVVSMEISNFDEEGIKHNETIVGTDIKIGIKKGRINIDAKVVEINYDTDLAILRVDRKLKVKPAPIAKEEPQLGEIIWSITNPTHLERMYLKGIFSKRTKTSNTINLAGVFGASGGMVLTNKGEIFGVFSTISIVNVGSGLPFPVPSLTIYNHSPRLQAIKNIINKVIKD